MSPEGAGAAAQRLVSIYSQRIDTNDKNTAYWKESSVKNSFISKLQIKSLFGKAIG